MKYQIIFRSSRNHILRVTYLPNRPSFMDIRKVMLSIIKHYGEKPSFNIVELE